MEIRRTKIDIAYIGSLFVSFVWFLPNWGATWQAKNDGKDGKDGKEKEKKDEKGPEKGKDGKANSGKAGKMGGNSPVGPRLQCPRLKRQGKRPAQVQPIPWNT